MHQASRRVIHTGAIASRATDGTIHSPAASGAALGSGTQNDWHEDTDQSTRTGDSSGGSDSRDTRSDRTRSRDGRSRSHSTRSNHRESLDWSIYHRDHGKQVYVNLTEAHMHGIMILHSCPPCVSDDTCYMDH